MFRYFIVDEIKRSVSELLISFNSKQKLKLVSIVTITPLLGKKITIYLSVGSYLSGWVGLLA